MGEDKIKIKRDKGGFPLEELVFQAQEPHGMQGVEDFRASFVEDEEPTHGFLVNYDGKNARTEYVRTNIDNQWDKFGVWFPNIKLSRALKLIGNQGGGKYKQRWLKEYSFGISLSILIRNSSASSIYNPVKSIPIIFPSHLQFLETKFVFLILGLK